MSDNSVRIKELVNVLGFQVDTASAAKAEAAMREFEDSAKRVGEVMVAAGAALADFINHAQGAAQAISKIHRAATNAGASMKDFFVQTHAASKSMQGATTSAAGLNEQVASIGKEAWRSSKNIYAIGIGVKEVSEATERAARVEKQLAATTRASTNARREHTKADDEGIGTLGRLGLAMQGVREVVDVARTGFDVLVGSMLEQSREMRQAAQVAGVSTDYFQELAFAAKTVRFEADDLRDVFVDLADKAFDASTGGEEQAKLFAALGVKVRDATGKMKPMETLLGDVADGFKKMTDGTKETGLASQLLGEQGARLWPVLNKGREGLAEWGKEAREAGAVLDGGTIQATADFDAKLARLQATGTGLRNVLGSALLPALEKLVVKLTEVAKRLKPVLESKAKAWAEGFAKAVDIGAAALEHLKLGLALTAGVLLGKYLLAVSTVTAAQIAWGNAALIAGARAAIAAALPILPWALLGALIVLVTEDIYGFATGSDSALGGFIKWLDKVNPEDNNLVKMLKRAGSLLFDLGDLKKWERANAAMGDFWIGAAKWIYDTFLNLPAIIAKALTKAFGVTKDFMTPREYGPVTMGGTAQEQRTAAARAQGQQQYGEKTWWQGLFAGSYQTEEQRLIENTRRYGSRDWVTDRGIGVPMSSPLMSLSSLPSQPSAYFGRGGTAEGAISSVQSARGEVGAEVFSPVLNANVTVNAAPGQSAAEVGRSATGALLDRYTADLRSTRAAFKKGG